jgi:hypothetical protein
MILITVEDSGNEYMEMIPNFECLVRPNVWLDLFLALTSENLYHIIYIPLYIINIGIGIITEMRQSLF